MQDRFDALRTATRADPVPDWGLRDDRLARLADLVRGRREAFARAIDADFGGRPQPETALAEVFPVLDGIAHARRHGARWMRPRRASAGRWLWPARAALLPRPVGVVGIVAPWNYPLMLAAGPLTSALVAGNRAMLKLSEHAPRFADAFADACADSFAADEVTVILGGPEVAEDFTQLPFDHLIFTGSTAVGRKVMAAAAQNLVPVTLELGGKSPALLAPDLTSARFERAVARVIAGKLLNAGQTCIAPDYLLVPEGHVDAAIAAARKAVAASYPGLARSPDYARIVNDRQFARLAAWRDGAGGALHPLSGAADDPAARLMAPVAVTGADPASPLMTEEIFGPILPILPYASLDEAVAAIAARPRPLAFYPFSDDPATLALLERGVIAGGVTANDTLLHVAAHDLPFGGVGDSGMGAYHGQAGFDRLSHLMPVLRQARWNAAGWLSPPYGRRFRWLMRLMAR